MTNISFFAKKPVHVGSDNHLQRVSSIVRAFQIAEYLGAKINPREGFEKDVCIYVKPPPSPDPILTFEEKVKLTKGKTFYDIVDSQNFDLAKSFPEVPVISLSQWNYKLLKRLLPNQIINIPQQHCNFARLKRNRQGITAVGCIGGAKGFRYLPIGLKEALVKRGIKLVEFSQFYTREDVVNFYMNIDVQIIWRPYAFRNHRGILMNNPLKIVNASSFGIPTLTLNEYSFREMAGCYIGIRSLEEFLNKLDELRANPSLYKEYEKRCLQKAEEYHIEKIAKLYQAL